MGGYQFVRDWLQEKVGREIGYVGRKASASPATGYHAVHKLEQAEILSGAFDPEAARRRYTLI
jgi:2-oxoglutarate dehydrogenase E1 component